MSNTLPSAEQYGTKTTVKAVDERRNENPLTSAEQYGTQTVRKAVDERKNERSTMPSGVQYGTQIIVKAVGERRWGQSDTIRRAIQRANRRESYWRAED